VADNLDGFVNYFRTIRDNVVRERDDIVFSKGFDTAANICVALLDERTSSLREQMKSGTLSPEDQRTYAALVDAKDAMEKELFAYWDRTEAPQ